MIEDHTHFEEELLQHHLPSRHSEILNFCSAITSFLASPLVVIHQTATHKCYLFGSSAILKSRTDLANLKVRQRESPRLAKSWQPSNHHPLSAAITRHAQPHQPCFAAPCHSLGEIANAKSKFVLVCPSCLLLSLIDGVGSAFSNESQTDTCACWDAVLHPKVPGLGKSCKTKVEQN